MPAHPSSQDELPSPLSLDRVALAYAEARIERRPELVITTAPQRWSYAAALPLEIDPAGGAGLAVSARVRVLQGTVGVGVLAPDQRSFVVEKAVEAKNGQAAAVVLRLPNPPVVGGLIVRNASDAGSSQAVLEEVTICRLPLSSGDETTAAGQASSRPAPDEIPGLVRSLEYLRPLVPYPGWRFDSDWHNPDFSFQTRRRLWEYCLSQRWEKTVDLPWHGGLRVELPLLSDTGRQLFVGGCIDPNEFVFLEGILHPDAVFLDVGANVGLYTLYAARRAKAVWAFEPSSRDCGQLRRNLELNNLSNVQALQVALGSSDETAEMHIAEPMHSGQNTLRSFSHAGVKRERIESVEVRALDRLLEENKLDRIDVLKLDVEQSELEVLHGASRVLRSMQPWLLLEAPQTAGASVGTRSQEALALLQDLGYVLYGFDASTGLVAEVGADRPSQNLIASPTRRPLPERVMTSRAYYFENSAAAGP